MLAMLAAFHVGPAFAFLWLAALVFAVFVIVDMARRPGWQWQQAGSSKVLWIVLEVVFILGFISIVVGVLYLAVIRPKLLAAEQQGPGGARWPGAPGWPGAAPSDGGWPGASPPPPTVPSGAGGAPPPYPGTAPPPYPGAASPPSAPPAGTPPAPATAQPTAPQPSEPQPSAPPFGWYPDPSGVHEMRYWDGVGWTAHVSDGGTQATDPLPG